MKVSIKSIDAAIDVKTNGIEFAVYNNDDIFLGDCYLTKTGLVWCQGKTRKRNGRKVTWENFIEWMNSE